MNHSQFSPSELVEIVFARQAHSRGLLEQNETSPLRLYLSLIARLADNGNGHVAVVDSGPAVVDSEPDPEPAPVAEHFASRPPTDSRLESSQADSLDDASDASNDNPQTIEPALEPPVLVEVEEVTDLPSGQATAPEIVPGPLGIPGVIACIQTIKGWSQGTLAKELGVTPLTISRWNTAKAEPSDERRAALVKLAAECGLEVKPASSSVSEAGEPLVPPKRRGRPPGKDSPNAGKLASRQSATDADGLQPINGSGTPTTHPPVWGPVIGAICLAEKWQRGKHRRLADALGVTPATIGNWVGGLRVPTGRTQIALVALARRHGIAVPGDEPGASSGAADAATGAFPGLVGAQIESAE